MSQIDSLLSVATLLHLAIALPVCGHILLNKTSESVAIGWIALVLFSPYVGSGLYWMFGINRIARKAQRYRGGPREATLPILSKHDTKADDDAGLQERQIFQFARSIHGPPFVDGNHIESLVAGDACYPAMLEAIQNAENSIALSVYIFDDDETGLRFVDALIAAHKRGVTVRVLLDDMGLRYSHRPVDSKLKRHGVSSARFIPRSLKYLPVLNLRNHRKLMIVDGHTGFIGGMNIRHGNMLSLKPKNAVQDIHFRVHGPVLDQFSALFEEDWQFAAGENIKLPRRQPNAEPAGTIRARLVADGPDNYFEKLQWVILGALAVSQKNVRIMTPYFLPNDVLASALMVAALRGVSVEVIIPKKLDIPFIDWAMTAKFQRLMEHGVRIFRTPAPFDHSKIMTVDSVWSLVGSTNWDQRSLRLNFEANLECYDAAFSREVEAYFDARKSLATPVSLKHLKQMPRSIRLRNNLVHLLSPYL